MSDLDKSRKCGIPTDSQHPTNYPPVSSTSSQHSPAAPASASASAHDASSGVMPELVSGVSNSNGWHSKPTDGPSQFSNGFQLLEQQMGRSQRWQQELMHNPQMDQQLQMQMNSQINQRMELQLDHQQDQQQPQNQQQQQQQQQYWTSCQVPLQTSLNSEPISPSSDIHSQPPILLDTATNESIDNKGTTTKKANKSGAIDRYTTNVITETNIGTERKDTSSQEPDGLDGKLSGLQAAAAKTALIVNGQPKHSHGMYGSILFDQRGDHWGQRAVVTTEFDEDENDHWIFGMRNSYSPQSGTGGDGGVAIAIEEQHQHLQQQQQRRVGFSNTLQESSEDEMLYQNGPILSHDTKLKSTTEKVSDEEERLIANLQSEKNHLMQQLQTLRRQRHHLHRHIKHLENSDTSQNTIQMHLQEWHHHLLTTQYTNETTLSSLQSLRNQTKYLEQEYKDASNWHVLGDVFCIWHRGVFGVINGIRLGRSAVTMAGVVKKLERSVDGLNGHAGKDVAGGGTKENTSTSSTGVSSFFSWGAATEPSSSAGSAGQNKPLSPSFGTSQTATNSNNNANPNNATSNNPLPEKVIVPWIEINSALGQVLFLLYTLQRTPFSGITFRKHVLQPCGSSSRIGFLKKHALHSLPNMTTRTTARTQERRRITALSSYQHHHEQHQNGQQQQPNISDSNGNTNKSGAMAIDSQLISTPPPTQPIPSHSQSTPTLPTKPTIPDYHADTPDYDPTTFHQPHEVTWYNLHHYEENGSLLSMGYFHRRNFNVALEGLLYCVVEACLVVERRDMALAAPYVMSVKGLIAGGSVNNGGLLHQSDGSGGSSSSGEATIGGLPFVYDPVQGERWTTVCKYLLTNLKWLIAYAAKHVDR